MDQVIEDAKSRIASVGEPGIDALRPQYSLRRFVVVGVVALGAGALVYGALSAGVLPGAVSLCVGFLVLVLLPTAEELSRRVAINGAVVIGLSPILWWFRWPFSVNHGTLVVAAGVAALVIPLARAETLSHGIRTLRPQVRPTDGLIALGGLAALAAMRSWAWASTPRSALEVLLPGVDNVAHFQIFSTMRAQGAGLKALGPAPDGTGWGFDFYPAGFHGLVATISELQRPRLDTGLDGISAYTQGVAGLVILGVVVLTAAIASLPHVSGRFWIAAPAVTATWMAFLWEPGEKVMADGFATFWLGTLAAAVALILALDPRRPAAIGRLVAIAALLVAVAHTWAPLLLVAAPAVLMTASGLVRRRIELRARLWFLIGVAVLLALGAAYRSVGALLAMIDFDFLVRTTGGITGTSPLPTFVLFVASLYVCFAFSGLIRKWARPEVAAEGLAMSLRVRLLGLTPLLAAVSLGILFVAQLRTMGTTEYFFLKYLLGVELILAAVVPAVVAVVVAIVAPPRLGQRGVLVSVGLTLLASQAFAPFPWGAVGLDANPGGTASVSTPFSKDQMASGIIAATAASGADQSFLRDYVALGAARASRAFYPDAWYHAILASSTGRTGLRINLLRDVRLDDPAMAAPTVRRILSSDDEVSVLVSPPDLKPLRDALPPDLAVRVISWNE